MRFAVTEPPGERERIGETVPRNPYGVDAVNHTRVDISGHRVLTVPPIPVSKSPGSYSRVSPSPAVTRYVSPSISAVLRTSGWYVPNSGSFQMSTFPSAIASSSLPGSEWSL